MARVVVVGAGVGGCCAALRLAASGHDVTVVEAATVLGGKLGRWSEQGYAFDTGPSLVTMPQVFADLFADVGERLDDHVRLQPVEPIAEYRWSDGTELGTTADPSAMAEAFRAAMGRDAADDWRALMTRAGRMWQAVDDPILRTPVRGLRSLLPLARRVADLRAIAPHRTLRDLARRCLHDPRQRMMLDRYATYTGSDPRRAPAALATIPYAELTFGGWYVAGGLYRLVEAIADLARERGACFRVGAAVQRITTSAGRVDGVVVSDGERLGADVVVANVDARTLYGSLVEAPKEEARLRRLAPSLSGFVLLLGLRGTTPGLAHHTVLFPTDYDAEFDALFGARPRPVADPTVYISRPPDPSIAPPDGESWFVLVNAPRHGDPADARRCRTGPGQVDWTSGGLARGYRDRVLDALAARGLDVRDRIVVGQTRTPADLEQLTGAPGGAIYGSSSNGLAAAFLRAANRSPVPGLFLVGGSSHPGGGLPLVALSAQLTAQLIGPA